MRLIYNLIEGYVKYILLPFAYCLECLEDKIVKYLEVR